MRERPIIFSGPMVQAIRDGRKTQTRRVVKPQPLFADGSWWLLDKRGRSVIAGEASVCHAGAATHCAYAKPGDRLWVRENYWVCERQGQGSGQQFIQYDDEWIDGLPNENAPLRPCSTVQRFGHHPSIHMPRWASRITLEVTELRVERVQEISEEDAVAEGVLEWIKRQPGVGYDDSLMAFHHLWDSINGKKHPWEANPWVWVVEFRRMI